MSDQIDPSLAARYSVTLGRSAAADNTPSAPAETADPRLAARYPRTLGQLAGRAPAPPPAPAAPAEAADPRLAKRYARTVGELEGKSGTPGAAGAASQPLELEAPESFNAQSPVFGEFRKLAGELGLDKERAGKVLSLYQRDREEQEKAWRAEVGRWRGELASDPEITAGGDGARKVVAEFGGQELLDALGDLGDHPAVVRTFVRIAAAMRRRGR